MSLDRAPAIQSSSSQRIEMAAWLYRRSIRGNVFRSSMLTVYSNIPSSVATYLKASVSCSKEEPEAHIGRTQYTHRFLPSLLHPIPIVPTPSSLLRVSCGCLMMSDPSSEFPSAAAARCLFILCSDRIGVIFVGLFLARSIEGACW